MKRYSICIWNNWNDENDVRFTRKLASDLKSEVIDVYYYDPFISNGQNLFRPLQAQMENSDCVIFLLSQNATAVSFLDEYAYKALRNPDALVVPAILDDAAAANVPPMFRGLIPIDFRTGYDNTLNGLLSRVALISERLQPTHLRQSNVKRETTEES